MAYIEQIHSSALNAFSFLGMDLSTGLAEDTYITFTPNATLTTAASDAGGRSRVISVNGDRSGKVEITLMTQSHVNRKLAAIWEDQLINRGGVPRISDITIKAGGTAFLYQPLQCHLMERPTQSIGKDMSTSTQTWVFDAAELNPISLSAVDMNDDAKFKIQADINVAITYTF